MQHLHSFDQFLLEEATPTAYDSTIIPALGKNIYQFLKSKGLKVKLEYQNQSLGQIGQSKHLGDKGDHQFVVASYPQYIILIPEYGEKFPEDLKSELISKFSSDDIESEFNSGYQHLVFRLKEINREYQAGRNRMREIPNQPIGSYDMMTKANRTQRGKGYSGISKQYRRATRTQDL